MFRLADQKKAAFGEHLFVIEIVLKQYAPSRRLHSSDCSVRTCFGSRSLAVIVMICTIFVVAIIVYHVAVIVTVCGRHFFGRPYYKLIIFVVAYNPSVAVNGTPSHSYGVSLPVWDHTVLPSTRHKRTHPALTPARGPYLIYLPWSYGRLS